MKKVVTLMLLIFFMALNICAFADGRTELSKKDLEKAKLTILGKLLTKKSFQDEILKDGYMFDLLRFEEADDGGTEPEYSLFVDKFERGKLVYKCFGIGFDVDKPREDIMYFKMPISSCVR